MSSGSIRCTFFLKRITLLGRCKWQFHVSPRKLDLCCWARLMRLFCRRPLQIIVVTPLFANKASTNINNFCPDRSGCTNVKCPQKRARHGWSPDVFGMSSSFEGAARCTLISGLRRLCSWLLFMLREHHHPLTLLPSSNRCHQCHEVSYFTRNSTPIIERCLAQGWAQWILGWLLNPCAFGAMRGSLSCWCYLKDLSKETPGPLFQSRFTGCVTCASKFFKGNMHDTNGVVAKRSA